MIFQLRGKLYHTIRPHHQLSIPEGPADLESVDVFYAYSVFSHMNDDDTAAYLHLIAEALSPAGKAFVTCFVEEGVPDVASSPVSYSIYGADTTARSPAARQLPST